jgi:glycosyltransferase involved in cell wall biosynthesis
MSAVSVVLPLNRIDSFTLPSIQSVLESKNVDLELIVVSDRLPASDFLNLRKKVNDPRSVFITSEGTGIVAALNTGISVARFDFIARMDGDDLCHPERLARQLGHLKRHKRVVAVGSNTTLVCRHGTSLGSSRFPRRVASLPLLKPFTSPVAHPAAMIRASVFRKGVSYRELFKGFQSEDFDLWYQLLDIGEINNLRGRYLQYRQHSNQVSTTKAKEVALSTLAVVLLDLHKLPRDAVSLWYEDPNGLISQLMSKERLRTLPPLRRFRANIYLGYLGAFDLTQKIRRAVVHGPERFTDSLNPTDFYNFSVFIWSIVLLSLVVLMHLKQILRRSVSSIRKCKECRVLSGSKSMDMLNHEKF